MELSDNARAVLKRRYFKKDQMGDIIEDEKAMLSRVSDNIAGGDKGKAKRYFNLMNNCYFLPNSPTLMNAGNDLQQLSACFVLPIEDSMSSIFDAVKNAALIHKSGGGTGFSFSKLREHNARVRSTSGVSSGPITFMKVFNSATDAVKQGGCLVQDTLIHTDEGTKYLSDICDTKQIGWKDHNFKVPTHEGLKISKQSYNNGVVKTVKIMTENGFELCGTPEHKVKVITEKGLVWKKICDLGQGDKLYVKLGQHIGLNADLFTDIELIHPNQNECKLPKNLTLEFAFWLGLLCGDGFVANNESDYRIGISINKDSYLVDYIEQLTRELFGVSLTKYQKKNDNSVTFVINNKKLKTFLIKNGFNKTDSKVCSIPKKLLQAKKEIIGSFLKGLFEADGTITHNYPSLSTTSKKLANEIAVLLRGLGIPCKKRIIDSSPDRFGDYPLFVVTVYSYIGLKRYLKIIGFNEKSRFSDLTLEKIDLAREKSFPLFNYKEIINLVLDKITLPQTDKRNRGKGNNYTSNFPELRKSLLRYLRGERVFSASSYLYYSEKYEEFKKNAPQIDFLDYYDEVTSIEDGGEKLTLDISVEDNHTYIANGFVTHNTRRGANMAILNVDHPDIIDFIKAKEKNTELNNFNLSIGLTETFMDAVKNNDEYELIAPHSGKVKKRLKARDVFELIVEMAHKNGEPGIVFIDRLDRYNPTPKDGKIEATNPCVTGDSLISTANGLITIEDLYKDHENGEIEIAIDKRAYAENIPSNSEIEFSDSQKIGTDFKPVSQVFMNGEKDVLKLTTKSGFELKATHDHKFLTTTGWKHLEDIKIGDKVLIQSGECNFLSSRQLPFITKNIFKGENGKTFEFNLPTTWSKELGQILGWLIGDGWVKAGDENCRVGFSFGDSDVEVMEYLKPIINKMYNKEINEIKRENNIYHLSYHSKYFVDFFIKLGVQPVKAADKSVPQSIFSAPKEAVVGFLQGLFSADGTVSFDASHGNYYVRLTSKSENLLKKVQILLLNLGIKSSIYNRSRKKRKGVFNYTNKNGENVEYDTDGVLFELNISRTSLIKFHETINFMTTLKRDLLAKVITKNLYKETFIDEVIEIVPAGKERVYDLHEPYTHSFICNSFVIHNCGEQPLLANEACNLGSINLAMMLKDGAINWDLLKETVYTATDFLDDVIDRSAFPLPEIEKQVKKNRKIGLGIMGWSDMLLQLGIPYCSDEAVDIGREIMEFIDYYSKERSMQLAVEKGSFPNFKQSIYNKGTLIREGYKLNWDGLIAEIRKKGIRNATTTTIAPTGTISMIADASSGVEPIFSLVYIKNVMDGEKLLYMNKYFEEIAKEQKFYSKELMEKISENGSLQDIDEIPDEVKRIFVTAHDITPEWHIRMQAAFQEFVDNAVSKTINFPNYATKEDIYTSYMLAYQLGCKGVTVYRDGSRDEQVLHVGKKMREHDRTRIEPRHRPETTIGVTKKINTGCGHLYVTINIDETGPCEVFTQMGKVGGCASAQLEAIARLISLALRSNVKVESIVKQLRLIRCPSPMWSKGKKIHSCADAIANALIEFLEQDGNGLKKTKEAAGKDQLKVISESPSFDETSPVGSMCPECGATLEFKEGCKTCPICGWSKCS